MTIHKLKCWPEFFARIKTGAKKVEIRKNDRDYKVGDKLLLEEFVPEGRNCEKFFDGTHAVRQSFHGPVYTGETIRAIVTDVFKLEEVPGLLRDLSIMDKLAFDALDGAICETVQDREWVKAKKAEYAREHKINSEKEKEEFVELSLTFPGLQYKPEEIIPWDAPKNVLFFMDVMISELDKHASKGDHENIGLTGGQCVEQLRQQVHELEQAMLDFAEGKVLPPAVIRKAAGVSNYAMFCVQVSGALQALGEQKQ